MSLSKTNKRVCGKCGAELTGVGAEQLCPGCLLEGGLAPVLDREPTADQPATRNPQSAIESAFPRPFGDYELLEEIARGGMGIVYKARQVSLDRLVAVKMLLFGPLAQPEIVQRFRTEVAAAASLQHPNIVAIHEVGFREGQHFFAMDYVAGRSLGDIVRDGPLGPKRAAGYVKTIAEAIQYAHERGILHRDLKPSNVLIDEHDQPKVTDFGLAKRLEKDSELTLSGQVLGSPSYMPPEQAAAHRGLVGKRSDVYSLGAILYHLLTGRAPFVAPTVGETLQQVQMTDPVSPTVLNPHLPRDLKTICLKCLEKEPARRYQTARELADDLGRWLRQEPILARPIGPAGKAWRWCRRKPAIAGLVAAVILSVAVGFAGIAWQWQRTEQARREAEAAFAQAADTVALLGLVLAQSATDTDRQPLAVRSPDGQWLLQMSSNVAGVFNLKTKTALGGPMKLSARIMCAAFSPDSRRFVVGLADGTVRIESVQMGQATGQSLHHGGSVNCVQFSPDGLRIATGSDNGTVRVWDSRTGRAVMSASVRIGQAIVSVGFNADGRRVISVSNIGTVSLWDVKTGTCISLDPSRNEIKTPHGTVRIRG